jgi:predicted MFS family arabinose efflux permease
MQMRVVYPFLPAISRGLGLPLQTTSLLLTVRALANLSSPLYGTLSDWFGRRAVMIAGLAILVAGAGLVLTAPSFPLVLAAFAFLSVGKASYDPAVLAYLGDAVPYQRRGRIMGLLAMMWPAAWLLGVPAAGFLISAYTWRAPFAIVGLLSVAALVLMLRSPQVGAIVAPVQTQATLAAGASATVRIQLLSIGTSAWLGLSVTLLQVLAIEHVSIVYAAWLEGAFGLSLAAIGLVSIVICLAEFAAEGVSMGWVDRIGKRRAVLFGLLVSAAAYLLLPQLATSLPGAMIGLFLVWIAWDFSIVSTLPLISELAPSARATLLALNVTAMALARLISSVSAVRLWAAGGLALTTTVSAVSVALALVILWLGVKDHA